jgi:hypothetical protein
LRHLVDLMERVDTAQGRLPDRGVSRRLAKRIKERAT